jgi:ATP phosphoribosyltransferase
MRKSRLKIALQKKGRLQHDCIDLLLQCGLKVRLKKNALLCHGENLPVDLLFVRDDDIPVLVSDNVCDLGVVGENVLLEQKIDNIMQIKQLGFGRCRLSIAAPIEFAEQGISALENCKIATSYPNLLTQYLNKNKIKSNIITLTGSVEIAPRLAMADAICDLVSTGSTLEENHLKEIEPILFSQAVLIKSAQTLSPEKQAIYDLLLRRINGVIQAQGSKYIMFHAPRTALSEIKKYLPGCETPTILPLEGIVDKVAVHIVSGENVFWETLEKLKEAGASSILVMPIEKMLT